MKGEDKKGAMGKGEVQVQVQGRREITEQNVPRGTLNKYFYSNRLRLVLLAQKIGLDKLIEIAVQHFID